MLEVITKKEYFTWCDKGIANSNRTLKGIQDAWVTSLFSNKEDLKIAEIGGGNSRVLNSFSNSNEGTSSVIISVNIIVVSKELSKNT